MTTIPITPPPGVFTVPTPLMLGEGWQLSNQIRFKDGQTQVRGGVNVLPVGFAGVCRGLLAFFDQYGVGYDAIGTTNALQLYSGSILYDITPVNVTDNLATPFYTQGGSATVAVNDPSYLGAAPS